jgi:flagellar M-ring protein FliF
MNEGIYMANDSALITAGTLPTAGQLGGRLMLLAGIAAVGAVMFAFWMWSQQPDYRVLFSNYADKDGGAIVAALEKMNVPYKFSESGSAILVPAEHVHKARLKLAADGLPKGGNIGFELLENQKFGVSQFVEQVNFQRGLEGELERSIQAIDAVQTARIHLAIPKPSVFVRDQQNPTASVLLNLQGGRTLDAEQVGAIVHLVASSVPNLPTRNVTVVDQNGNLLSDTSKKPTKNGLDPTQIKYVDDLQRNIVNRVESIITPIVGLKNVRAEASAEIDFSSSEQAAEKYKPNTKPDDMTVRSAQISESTNGAGNEASGVPGALSNQPPAPSTAPIDNQQNAGGAATTQTAAVDTQKNSTTNYEVDKTVSYIQQPMGGIKRLHVAVVVNNITTTDNKGKVTTRPLTDAEKKQINDLAMQAMGFNKDRGDSLTVVNTSFAGEPVEMTPAVPMWKNPIAIEYGKDALRFIVGLIVMMMVYKKVLKPMLTKLTSPISDAKALENKSKKDGEEDAVVTLGEQNLNELGQPAQIAPSSLDQNLQTAKQLAKDNPRMVANVVSGWTSGD